MLYHSTLLSCIDNALFDQFILVTDIWMGSICTPICHVLSLQDTLAS